MELLDTSLQLARLEGAQLSKMSDQSLPFGTKARGLGPS
jgi:hypothetical protein